MSTANPPKIAGGPLRRMEVEEFLRRLRMNDETYDGRDNGEAPRYALFLGAGCSRSSGIPTAKELVKDRWLPRLHRIKAPHSDDMRGWVWRNLPWYDLRDPGSAYGQMIEELFHQPIERQAEIEALCSGIQPSFGYTVLAQLIADKRDQFNIVLTTNFDDLVSDALYLYTDARPLVVHHDSLAEFIRPTRKRPLLVKLHGDHRLTPRNTAIETEALQAKTAEQTRMVLHDRGLIFLGYGGHDTSIRRMLQDLPGEALPHGVYWVSHAPPDSTLTPWLQERGAYWIPSEGFDEFMLLVQSEFGFPPPDEDRFMQILDNYGKRFEALNRKLHAVQRNDSQSKRLKDAAKKTAASFTNHWWAILQADSLEADDPDEAERIYRKALEDFPNAVALLGSYAVFLKNIRKDYDRAEEVYAEAHKAEPDNPIVLGNYANFLWTIRRAPDRAEPLFRQAIETASKDPSLLSNYAAFLFARGRPREASKVLQKAFRQAAAAGASRVLFTELWFYAYAHGGASKQAEALRKLRPLLADPNTRSPHWDFTPNIERAIADGHPEADWLRVLAAVINDREKPETLNRWRAWQAARPGA